MKKMILFLSVSLMMVLYSSNTSEPQASPPPNGLICVQNGLICVQILGISGCYPENWEDDWQVCIIAEYELNGEEITLELCKDAVLNQDAYCWTASEGLYVTISPKLLENGQNPTPQLKCTQTTGYVNDEEPLVCTVSWVCQ